MDTIFTQLVNGGNGPVIRDGVDQSTRPASVDVSLPGAAQPGPTRPCPSTTSAMHDVGDPARGGAV